MTFSVGLDGTIAAPGQIIRVADSARAGKRQGGRVSSATTTVVTVDAAPTVAVGDSLTVIMPDGISQTRTVSAVSGNVITVSTAFTSAPLPESVWTVESTTLAAQTYRVLAVTEDKSDKDISFTITALQHNASKFDAVDTGTAIVVPPISALTTGVQSSPLAVTLSAHAVVGQVATYSVLTIAWEAAPGATRYTVEWRRDDGEWLPVGNPYGLSVDVVGISAGTYTARVRAVSSDGNASLPRESDALVVADASTLPTSIGDIQGQAADAQAAADAANAALANIASDGILAAGEKPPVIRDYSVITTEQAGIDAQATAYGVTTEKTTYDGKVTALTTYLGTLGGTTAWNDLSGNTTIDGPTFRAKFADVYTSRQALLNAIYAAAKAKADAAQATANQAVLSTVVQNANFTDNLDGWTFEATPGPVGGGEFYQESLGGSPYAPIPTYLVHAGVSVGSSAYAVNQSNIPVQPGQQVIGVVSLRSLGANSTARAQSFIRFYNASGGYLGFLPGTPLLTGTGSPDRLNSTAKGPAPAGAAFAKICVLYTNHTSGYITATCAQLTATISNQDDLPDGASYTRNAASSGSAIVVGNANFEAPIDPQGNVPGWIPDSGATLAYSAAAFSGSQCLEVTGHGTVNFGARTPNFQCAAGDTIYAQCRGYSVSGNAAALTVVFLGAGGVLDAPLIGFVAGYGTWQLVAGSAVAPTGTTAAYVKLFNSATSGASRFDDVQVARAVPLSSQVAGTLSTQRNLPLVTWGNYGGMWSGLTLNYSTTTTSCTFSASAGSFVGGGDSIPYNASSVTVSGTAGSTVVYYLYYDDPSMTGGSKSLQATTAQLTSLNANGRVLVNKVSVTYPTSGTGGGGGGAMCPVREAWVIRPDGYARAADVHVGDELLLCDGRWGRVSHSAPALVDCVRVRGAHGSLSCSATAPLGLAGGGQVLAPDSLGATLATRRDGGTVDTVAEVAPIGQRWVQHITCENTFFWAGDDQGCLYSHHNLKGMQ